MYFAGIHVRLKGEETEFEIIKKQLRIIIPPKTLDNAGLRLEVIRDEYDETTGGDSPRILYEGSIDYICHDGKRETTESSVDRMFFNESFL